MPARCWRRTIRRSDEPALARERPDAAGARQLQHRLRAAQRRQGAARARRARRPARSCRRDDRRNCGAERTGRRRTTPSCSNYAAHDPIMRRAALVVTHGGHGTAMRALGHGVSDGAYSRPRRDQPFVAAAIQESAPALALPGDTNVGGDPRSGARAFSPTPAIAPRRGGGGPARWRAPTARPTPRARSSCWAKRTACRSPRSELAVSRSAVGRADARGRGAGSLPRDDRPQERDVAGEGGAPGGARLDGGARPARRRRPCRPRHSRRARDGRYGRRGCRRSRRSALSPGEIEPLVAALSAVSAAMMRRRTGWWIVSSGAFMASGPPHPQAAEDEAAAVDDGEPQS